MDVDIKRLIHNRGQIKSSLTRFKTFCVGYKQEQGITLLQTRLEKIEESYKRFDEIQGEIEYVLTDSPDLAAHVAEREKFESLYFELVTNARSFIKTMSRDREIRNVQDNLQTRESPIVVSEAQFAVKLPTISLPVFDGSLREWIKFRDTFHSLIHSNRDLTNIQKFHYLESSLKGDAANVIHSLGISDANYEVAWQSLIKRYEDSNALIHNHVELLFNLPHIQKASHLTLRRLIDDAVNHLRALKGLNEPTEYWDTLVIYLLSSKLDPQTKREWEKRVASSNTKQRWVDMVDFLNKHCSFLERITSESLSTNTRSNFNNPTQIQIKQHKDNVRKTNSAVHVTTSKPTCQICNASHSLFHCENFLKLSPQSRFKEVQKHQLCFNCLSSGHHTKACTSGNCKKCQRKHNTLLHFNQECNSKEIPILQDQTCTSLQEGSASNSKTLAVNMNSQQGKEHDVLLSTAMVTVFDSKGNGHPCRVLLDSGAQSHIITEEFCKKLNLPVVDVKQSIAGIAQTSHHLKHKTHVKIQSTHNAFTSAISCLIMPKITDDMPNFTMQQNLQIPKNIILADPGYNKTKPIDLLIGASLFWNLLCVGQITLGKNQPILQKTKLGWVLAGPVVNVTHNQTSRCHVITNQTLHHEVTRFWKQEECDIKQAYLSTEEELCETQFSETTIRNAQGQFIVQIPFKDTVHQLGDSYAVAKRRFLAMERKLRDKPELKERYIEFMREYESLGHMSKVPCGEIDTVRSTYYLPHHAVINENSISTKVRVVFDGSCKSTSGLSLNEVQHVGPTIQDDLFSIITRFRKHTYVISADISKMYRQILVDDSQRDYQRVFWREQNDQPIEVYRLNTVTYGTASAPFLAIRSLIQLSKDFEEIDVVASKVIAKDFYVDDLLSGADTVSEVVSLKERVSTILQTANFELRKWRSNSQEIISKDEALNPQVVIQKDDSIKTLGLLWNSGDDTLQFSIELPTNDKVSKRGILSSIAKLFDPLGIVGPVVVKAKLIIQALWQLDITWDETIPQHLHTLWITLHNQLPVLNQLRIPRHAFSRDVRHVQLHGFSDASEQAYGACIYVRSTDKHGNHSSHLLCAKSRVAPLKTLTIPRLELCAAHLLAKLINKVIQSLDTTIHETYLWCDSTIALTWISSSPSRWKIYVANRTTEIQDLTQSAVWNHISTSDNPADIISRGCAPNELVSSTLWWHGPQWLCEDSTQWPLSNQEQGIDIPEAKTQQVMLVATDSKDNSLFDRYSSLNTLIRVIAYCKRFINNTRTKQRTTGSLSTSELHGAMVSISRLVQQQEFSSEIQDLQKSSTVSKHSKLCNLNPFLDERGLIRVGGRLKQSCLTFNHKHPIVLPGNHPFTLLIIRYEHKRLLHAGCSTTLAAIRARFWPLNCKNTIKKLLRQCITCFKVNPKSNKYMMGDLPSARVNPSRPFSTCGIDYAGPFYIKEKTRSRITLKCYLCVFICFATKAVHFELAVDLSTESFLNCLKRFTSRRGLCRHIYSDNGTNFVGARNELHEISQLIRKEEFQEKISTTLAKDGITWHFIPPRAPNFGGLWERTVQSAKQHLKRIIGDTHLTFEELYTVFTQIEACLNSRPLTAMSDDPNDMTPLTPGHFLIGDALTAVPQVDVTHTKVNCLKRYQLLQQMIQHFWRRWREEYLHELQQRTKWKQAGSRNLNIGDMVVLHEDNVPPLKWPLGRIVDVHAGKDSIIRVVTIKTTHGLIKRPVSKVCVLPTEHLDINTQSL